MSTTVWILVMFGYGSNIVTGPEFKTQHACEYAAIAIKQSADDRITIGNARKPWCVRIEK